ncbi:hypothetical protein CC78DRAFT_537614 [Lojkania enalia]|uniref:Uncharacterized protein n=1 Tax=Lojkania enalia TaxID=147567 RepID=A0A9P4N1F1_9PLEO|nr:hypothetical protein CC78DRAFT_537614 [Didymosphaeria enalia]
MSALPVIVCGKNPSIAAVVRKHLLPEYDVTHIITSPEVGAVQIPLVLAGKAPPNSFENLGSRNYGKLPVAVAAGGGYDDDSVKLMQDACKDVKAVPWLRPNLSQFKNMPSFNDVEAYGTATAIRLKRKLEELNVGGENGTKDGVHLY